MKLQYSCVDSPDPTLVRPCVKPFILKLKPLVSSDLIKFNLAKMIREIETGESINAYSLFHLFHENLDLLTDDEQELVVIYILNIMPLSFSN